MFDWSVIERTVPLGPDHSPRRCVMCDGVQPFVRLLTYRVFRIVYVIRFSYDKRYSSQCARCSGGDRELHEDEVLRTLRRHPVKWLDRFGGIAVIGAVALLWAASAIEYALR